MGWSFDRPFFITIMGLTKVFYCVSMTIYEDLRVETHISSVAAYPKPKSSYKETHRADYYLDYFNTLEEAQKFVNRE